MEEEKMNLEGRILNYHKYYDSLDDRKIFNFDENPQRLIVKNYSLRNRDKLLYTKYLNTFYPESEEMELQKFDAELLSLKRFGKDELAKWLEENKITLLQSDINSTDKDAIFNVIKILPGHDINKYLRKDDLVLNYISAVDVLALPFPIWVNIKLA